MPSDESDHVDNKSNVRSTWTDIRTLWVYKRPNSSKSYLIHSISLESCQYQQYAPIINYIIM